MIEGRTKKEWRFGRLNREPNVLVLAQRCDIQIFGSTRGELWSEMILSKFCRYI